MPGFWNLVGYGGHGLAALLLAALAIIVSRRRDEPGMARHIMVAALAISALWSLQQLLGGIANVRTVGGAVAETVRNGAWLAYIVVASREAAQGQSGPLSRRILVTVLLLLLLAQLLLDMGIGGHPVMDRRIWPLFELSWLFRCMFALGALTLLNALFSRPTRDGGRGMDGWVAAALTFMWAFDCNHHGIALMTGAEVAAIGPMRGLEMVVLAIVVAIGAQAGSGRRLRLSRVVVHRAAAMAVCIIYLLCVLLLVAFANAGEGYDAGIVAIAALFAVAVAALAILPSSSLRSWLKVELAKHVFAYRYDYRVAWRCFTDAVSQAPEAAPRPLGERIARGVAQITGSSGGLLLLRDAGGGLAPADGWRWPIPRDACRGIGPDATAAIAGKGWIVDFTDREDRVARTLPSALRDDRRLWALIPAMHDQRLVGAVLLLAPRTPRRLDWEDLDMMRVIGGQAGAAISETLGREALVEAQRFEEFNRRFAFILHDIKNQVSHMSLLARNAERHAENPAFRQDMVVALKETATRMTDLLQKLNKPVPADGVGGAALPLGPALRAWAPVWSPDRARLNVVDDSAGGLVVHADDETLSRALGQLVDNALEASGEDAPVTIRLRADGADMAIDIIDTGPGMSAEFIRSSLFRPFASTKASGFGLGAQEARTLIEGMGGRLDVTSEEGRGTIFTVRLLRAPQSEPQRLPLSDNAPSRRRSA